ncbi:MAG: L-tyrosine/L-tryptophan isonitrile synthase family protein, partial [Alphaproteobacteria bacterium]|nr:L-tyrosine/L-tryptophan isonitrile synthase family protein [Alphaproteobacteria bacterium]
MKILYAFAFTSNLLLAKQFNPKKIINIIQSHVLEHDIDAQSIGENCPAHSCDLSKSYLEKISDLHQNKLPLHFTMVGFPYKSMNTKKKTLTASVDAAERYSLVYLNTMLKKLQAYYDYPVKLTIYMDGAAFSDIAGLSDARISQYEQELKAISSDLHHIKIKTLKDILPNLTPNELRQKIEQCESSEETFYEASQNAPLQQEIAILKKRMAFEMDCPEGIALQKKYSILQISKKILHRSLQFSHLLNTVRPLNSIRLSVHYQKDCTKKIGIKLSHNSYVTPWHGVLVVDSFNNWRIQHLQDIDQKQFVNTTMTINGIKLPYFLR